MSLARAKALKTFSVVGIALLMVWSTVLAFTAVAADESGVYMVSIDDDTSPEVLRTTRTKVLVDYNNGNYLVRATESQALGLTRLGLDAVKFKNLRLLDMYPSDVTFDTSEGIPSAPSMMDGFDTHQGTYIVQFMGPYKSEWAMAVENLGGRIGKALHAFSAVVKMSPSVKSQVEDLSFVNWVGDYKPWYKISSELLNSEGGVRVAIMTFEDSQRAAVSEKLVEWGASVLMSYPTGTIIAFVDAELLPWVVSMPEVMQVFPDYMPEVQGIVVAKIHKAYDAWYSERSGLPTTLTGRSPGPDGIDYTADDIYEVIGVQDSGFDMCDPNAGHPDFFLGPNGDRVIRMVDQSTYSCPDGKISGTAHGTHVAGDAMGNGYAWEDFLGEPTTDADWSKSEGPGMAPEAKLSFDGVQAFGPGLWPNPAYWDLQYADGAHINTNSYGSPPADYGGDSNQVDLRINNNNDRLIFFAASNEGPDPNTLSSNTQGKNGLSIGASLNFRPDWFEADNPNLIADFSSRGGEFQSLGRLKPDLVAVGTAGVAPFGPGEWQYNEASGIGNPQPSCIMTVDVYNYNNPAALDGDGICDYRYMGGTSAASPHAAGLGALVREYLREIGGISDPFAINSQLVKALMINGAVRMDEALYDYPGYDQGWGRINLQQSLFPQVPRSNKYEETTMATTGQWTPSFSTYVKSDDVPFKATLVWVDVPLKALNRDLNLRVTSPSGDEYWGNIYGTVGQFDGWTIPNPSTLDANPLWDKNLDGWDDVNNVEQVEVEFPEVGNWFVEVIGVSVITPAPLAIVVGADFGPQQEFKVDLDTEAALSMEATQNGDVFFPFSVTNFGTSVDNVFMSSTTIPGISINFENTVFLGIKSQETISSYTIISVAGGVMCGVHDLAIKGTSLGNTAITDQIEIELSIKCDLVVTPFQLTNATIDELDPSVLTFNDGSTDWIFIAYRKTTAVWADDRFGGVNVWVAYTTLDGEGMPVLPFNHVNVSNWNDGPNDLRWLHIPQGTYQNRIILTWTGDDPDAVNPDLDSYGVLYYSDFPYTQWNKTVIERNAGRGGMNEARVNIPIWRNDSSAGGEVIWVFEHLDYLSASSNNPRWVQTWIVISDDGGETFPVCDVTSSGADPDCKRISPNDANFYFFPNACMDSKLTNPALWVFFYYRTPAGNDRDLMVRVYDDLGWQGDGTPIDPRDDVSLLWNTENTNLQWPSCVGANVGGKNRMHVTVTNDQGGVDLKLFSAYLEGEYGYLNPPFGRNWTELSGISPNLIGPYGPMGLSVSNSNYDRRPITQMVTTNDGYTWITYIENANEFGVGNLMTVATTDAFETVQEYSTLTANSYAKGHQMTDTLTVNVTRHNVYEVYHASKGTESDVNYDVYLLVYHKGWESDPDTVGPVTDPIVAVPNPFDISVEGKDVQLFATMTDTSTGMSNISYAEWIEVPLSVVDPRLIDWTGALPMIIGTDSPTETGMATYTPTGWDGGETHRLCARGQDKFNNWGIGDCVDVTTIGKKPVYREFWINFTATGWQLISIPLTVSDTTLDSVFQDIAGMYDELRVYDGVMGKWLFWNAIKPAQTLTNVDKTMGIWIHITDAAASIHITGNLTYVTEIPLEPGWNLIGYPSLNSTGLAVDDLLNDPTLGIDAVEGFDGLRSPYFLKDLGKLPGPIYLQPGKGYWVHVSGTTGRTLPVPGGF